MDHIARIYRPAHVPDVFTAEYITSIRSAIREWERRPIHAGPRLDGQLSQIIELMLGTSARIGEVLAVRLCDLNLRASIPTVRISGTIVSGKGEPTHRQDHPKTSRSVRRIALPSFAVRAIRARMRRIGPAPAGTLLFSSRAGSPLTTNNIRRQLRDIMDSAGVADVTPHRFRRTVATTIHEVGGLLLAAELLGHSDPRITVQHYIQRDEAVDPITAQILDKQFGSRS